MVSSRGCGGHGPIQSWGSRENRTDELSSETSRFGLLTKLGIRGVIAEAPPSTAVIPWRSAGRIRVSSSFSGPRENRTSDGSRLAWGSSQGSGVQPRQQQRARGGSGGGSWPRVLGSRAQAHVWASGGGESEVHLR